MSNLRQRRILAAQLDGASRRLANLTLNAGDVAGQQGRIDALVAELPRWTAIRERFRAVGKDWPTVAADAVAVEL